MALAEILDIKKSYVYKKGKEEGIEQDRIVMAKKMKAEGLDLDLIARITGLSVEEIQKL